VVDESQELFKKKKQLTEQEQKLQKDIAVLTKEVQSHMDAFDADVSLNKEKFFNETEARVTEEHENQVQELTKRINELDEKISSIHVDDTDESVREAVEKRDYLNAAAIEVQAYYNVLLDISEEEFIELAITTKTISMQAFRKEMGKLDYYKRSLSKLESKQLMNMDGERNVWLQAILLGPILAVRLPFLLIKAVRRAKVLHLFSRKYYVLVETLMVLSQATNEEIVSTLKGVVNERKDNLYQKKVEAGEALSKLREEIREKINAENEKCPDFADVITDLIFDKNQELDKLNAEHNIAQEELRVVTEKLDAIMGRMIASYREIQNRFLNPSNTEKSSNMPNQLIYNFTKTSNIYFPFCDGLWIYTDRIVANKTVQSIVFQLRNYMAWGSITFQVFDVLMATFLAQMMFPDNCDIRVYSLKEEQQACIDVLHDVLIRRSAIVLGSHSDITQYNTYQAGIDAPTLPFEVVIIFQEAVGQLSEKLVQILSLGPKLGIIVCVFLRSDLINDSAFKIYERYVSNVILLTKSGISVEEPSIFKQRFEKKPPRTKTPKSK